jgi:hypothetical protein
MSTLHPLRSPLISCAAALVLAAVLVPQVRAQEVRTQEAGGSAELPALEKAAHGTWSEARGSGPTRHDALGQAIEGAVMRVNGLRVATGPALRARLGLVKTQDGSVTTTEGTLDVARVVQQLEGFVDQVEVKHEQKGPDGQWTVQVRCLVAAYDPKQAEFVVQLAGAPKSGRDVAYQDLGTCLILNIDEESGAQNRSGPHAIPGTRIGDCLVGTNRVKLGYRGPGVRLDGDSDPRQAGKTGKGLVATHRIDIEWDPVVVRVVTRKQSKSRPTSRRAQDLDTAYVTARIAVRNLVEKTELPPFELPIVCPAEWFRRGDVALALDQESLLAMAQRVAAFAEVEVAKRVYFALRPPLVLNKKQGEGDRAPWLVEVDLPRHLAAEFDTFEFGRDGSLGGSGWRPAGRGKLVGGEQTSIFELDADSKPAEIQVGATRLEPTKTK